MRSLILRVHGADRAHCSLLTHQGVPLIQLEYSRVVGQFTSWRSGDIKFICAKETPGLVPPNHELLWRNLAFCDRVLESCGCNVSLK